MGVIQNSLVGMMNTIMGGLAATRFVKGQQEGNVLAKTNLVNNLDRLQDDYLQNKSGIETNIEEGNINYGILTSQLTSNEEKEAAMKALTSAQEKLEVLSERNKRIEYRFNELSKQYPDEDFKLVGYEEQPKDKLKGGNK